MVMSFMEVTKMGGDIAIVVVMLLLTREGFDQVGRGRGRRDESADREGKSY